MDGTPQVVGQRLIWCVNGPRGRSGRVIEQRRESHTAHSRIQVTQVSLLFSQVNPTWKRLGPVPPTDLEGRPTKWFRLNRSFFGGAGRLSHSHLVAKARRVKTYVKKQKENRRRSTSCPPRSFLPGSRESSSTAYVMPLRLLLVRRGHARARPRQPPCK